MRYFGLRKLSPEGTNTIIFVVGLVLFIMPLPALGQLEPTGFIRNYNAVQHRPDHDLLIGRNRLRLNLNKSFSKGEIVISNDLQNLYSASADSLKYLLREAYVDLYFSNSDLRIGKQVIVWGRAEGTFISDLITPVDLSEFLTQDFEDLRKGVTAINYTRYFGSDFLQLILNPVFAPNEIPAPDSRWFPRQILPTSISTSYLEGDRQPSLKNMQIAGRYAFRSNLNFDLDLNLLYWHYPNPSYYKGINTDLGPQIGTLELTEIYTQSLIASYSGSLQLFDKLLFTFESAYFNRKSFDYLPDNLRALNLQNPSLLEQVQIAQIFSQNTDGFLIKKPQLISMVGLQYELFDVTLSAQLINEHIFDYDSEIIQEEDYYYSTLLLRRSFARDTWNFQTFARYNFSGKDYWVNPELTYTGIDSFEATIGSQFFSGQEPDPFYGHLSFKNFAPSSYSYLRISAYF